ncbi:MAG TPA: thiopurine S-methyltransferase [Chromatiaceae bacterium]|jgi:thiopurine S-methyltransferase|nr:thiopurine S-methyltransferase [Chromatiaceae bacterium]
MHPDFWHQRWLKGETGWHQEEINPHLQAFWPPLSITAGARVLVPLCGKSRDMLWLAGEGYRVLGVEISPLGVEAFFAENGLSPEISDAPPFRRHRVDELEILCGDFFDLRPEQVTGVTALFDRASLIALPPAMRPAYVRHLHELLPAGAQVNGLLVTLDYEQTEWPGPPFAVTPAEVNDLHGGHFHIQELAALDLLAMTPRYRERGLSRMMERVYRLTSKATTAADS